MEANRTAPQQAGVDLDALRDAFSGRLITDPADLEAFTVDWRRRYFGRTLAAAQPDSVEGVAAIVRWCAQHRVAVVPQGGNTGLVGGQVKAADAVEKGILRIDGDTAQLQRFTGLFEPPPPSFGLALP